MEKKRLKLSPKHLLHKDPLGILFRTSVMLLENISKYIAVIIYGPHVGPKPEVLNKLQAAGSATPISPLRCHAVVLHSAVPCLSLGFLLATTGTPFWDIRDLFGTTAFETI